MTLDEELVFEAVTEFQRTKTLSDTTYARLVSMFGEPGVIDLIGLVGYYGMLAGILNVARTTVPEGPRLPPLGG
jgi:4-carboxymuconolactone decarboxylase